MPWRLSSAAQPGEAWRGESLKKLATVLVAGVAGPLALLLLVAAAVAGSAPRQGAVAAAAADIPADLFPLYHRAAATCPGLGWTVLAAIGKVETDHGRSRAPGVTTGENPAGAGGPMQFLAATWAAYGVDANEDGRSDRYDPADAIFGAANYLCVNGAADPRRLPKAVFAYNHANWYAERVLELAAAYEVGSSQVDPLALLQNPRLTLSDSARADLNAGVVDVRLVAALADLLQWHTLTVGVFKTGHTKMIVTDTGPGAVVSTHYYGRGADIMAIDGAPVSRANLGARQVVLEMRALLAGVRYEVGQPWSDLVQPGTFTNQVHQDHIHVGLRN